MCGIFGYLHLADRAPADRAVLARMGAQILHRGPDDAGIWVDQEFGFGMQRLSIIDVSGGHQPIFNEDESAAVVCNGEVYNFRELRAELEQRGHRFRTGSDTEVIVHAYEEYGLDFVRRLDGMFGFALWDKRARRLLIGRDALGIKPLYLYRTPKLLAFASEAKSLFALPGFAARLDPAAARDFLSLGYVPAPRAIFAGVEKLAPGTMLVAADGRQELRTFWSLPRSPAPPRSDADAAAELRHELERAVVAQMVSDVPIGAFLSGGLDSSAVVAFMARHTSHAVKTYSIGFAGSSGSAVFNELPYAKRVAERFGTDHHEIVVNPDVLGLLPKLQWHLDEPVADSAALTTYLVAELARREVTVILSGVGGDEIFAGYNRYLDQHYGASYARIPRFLRDGVIAPLARRLPSDRHHPVFKKFRYLRAFVLGQQLGLAKRYRSYVGVFDDTALGALTGQAPVATTAVENAFAEFAALDPIAQCMAVDIVTQLPDDLLALTDRASMAVSLECRVPLLDQRLVEFAAGLPGTQRMRRGEPKSLMKRALHGVLPEEILHREKRGFGAPVGAWLKKELLPVAQRILSPQAIEQRGLFRASTVDEMWKRHLSGHDDLSDQLFALLALELWCQIFLDSRSHGDVASHLREAAAA
jgi:asparagine synthase (glutamine-hydrolysing)